MGVDRRDWGADDSRDAPHVCGGSGTPAGVRGVFGA
jgi:hypothetical protein